MAQGLIESAKINSQVSQLQQYDIAINQFKSRFKQIPGDSDQISLPDITGGGSTAGDNNGTLATGTACTVLYPKEPLFFFAQLSATGMIKETYVSGWITSPNNSRLYEPGRTHPKARIGDGGILIADIQVGSRSNSEYFYYLGAASPGYEGFLITQAMAGDWIHSGGATGAFTPTLALALDSKIDDGLANSGDVAAVTHNPSAYSTGCNDFSTTYHYPWQVDNGGVTISNRGCNSESDVTRYEIEVEREFCRLAVKVEME